MADQLPNVDLWVLEHLAVPASLHGVDGRFLYVNPAAEMASGIPNAEWKGRRLTDRVAPNAREIVDANFRGVVKTGVPADFETRFTDASGEVRETRALQLPIRDGGEIVGVLILAFEVRPAVRTSELGPLLTSRQREVLALIASGLTTVEIARELTLSTETVRNHVRGVLKGLDAHTRPEAIAAAHRLGLLSAPPLRPQRADA